MPKLDGVRALGRLLDGNIQLRSRNNKNHEAPLTHIKNELSVFLKYLPPNSELDGELYSMKLSFNELSGIIRTKNKIHEKHDLVFFYIFDLIESKQLCWEKRYTLLVEAFTKYIEDGNSCQHFTIIQSYSAIDENDMLNFHTKFVNEGYEGIILRRYAQVEVNSCCKSHLKNNNIDKLCKKCEKAYKLTIYRPKRTNALIKHKNFIDEEVKITGFEVGIGTEEGAVIFQVLDSRGNTFSIRPRGTIDDRRDLYKKRNKLLGLPFTIRYQELSEYGVPRFPVGIAIRDYE
jgi:ATP-dependent DNA ligase